MYRFTKKKTVPLQHGVVISVPLLHGFLFVNVFYEKSNVCSMEIPRKECQLMGILSIATHTFTYYLQAAEKKPRVPFYGYLGSQKQSWLHC
jgi:hypothetical protein